VENKVYQKILVATDGSESVKKAVQMGVEIAKLSGANVYAAYVIAPGAYSARDFGWEKSLRDFLHAQGEKAITFVGDLGKSQGVKVEPVLLEGNPADSILEFAEKEGIELIVMGTLGRTGLDKFLLGSVAEKVVRHSKIPVMVVRGEKE
jgi:nucleotide-binding universal stress UspA family protein